MFLVRKLKKIIKLFKEPQGAIYHSLACGYAILMYILGIAGLFQTNWLINFLSTISLAHGMTIAAYMIHESGHNTIFRSNENNAKLGKFLTWICGACYGTFEDIRYKHFRHHVDNDDVAWFDHTNYFRRHPVFTKLVEILEWFYIPAHDLLMHFIMVFTSFIISQRRYQRGHNLAAILIRGFIFLAVLYFNTKAAILYATAYMIMIQILRFMDSLQHDYGYHLTLFSKEDAPLKGNSEYEQAHTFSNPHTLKYDCLNWFTLNFGFHNAHHARPIVPWYRLPALHRELYGDSLDLVIPLLAQLKMFHNFRVERVVFGEAREDSTVDTNDAESNFLLAAQQAQVSGGNAASFLTSF
ncbi:MAG: omega-6 fatty acid desaturase (delta-12 desaturase) [Gammaproteobacteria bacterium]